MELMMGSRLRHDAFIGRDLLIFQLILPRCRILCLPISLILTRMKQKRIIDESDFRFAHSHMCMVKCDVYGTEADTYFEGRNVMPVSVFTCKV
eukprot:scaffold1124_cov270-Chaetoceros_neogracile.AAC.11